MPSLLMVKQADKVTVGSRVAIRRAGGQNQFITIIDSPNAATNRGVFVVSVHAPLGQAVLGHLVGEHVTYSAPQGSIEVEIVSIEG